jgi:hypothetical protein
MIACKRGRISLAFILFLLAVLYLLIFSFPAKFTGLFISPHELEVSESILNDIENNSQARVIVVLKGINSVQSDVLSVLNDDDDFNIKYQYSLINAFSGNVTEQGLEKLRLNPNVEGIYPDNMNKPLLDKSAPLINATNVWQMQYNGFNIIGEGISVCVIDSGINYSHPALAGKVIAGYDFINNSEDFMDYAGHGTLVSGVIASNNGTYRGIAPGANLVAMKASFDGEIMSAIEWCVNNTLKYNISVISISLGGGSYGNQSACDLLPISQIANQAKAKNILIVAAAGNDGNMRKNMIASPACASNVTSVSATLQDDSIPELSQTASFLDLFAPGNITSTDINGGFSAGCGTSFSAPHVAGAAALIYQYEKLMGLNATPDEVEKVLKNGGKPICEVLDKKTVPYCRYFPRINLLDSINLIYKANVSDNSFTDSKNAKVKFNSQTNLTGIMDAFDISYNSISLNSGKYPPFNKSATLALYNLTFSKFPVILKDNKICTDCSGISYSNGNFTFNVTSFSNYSAGANSQMQIWDSSDSGMPFFSGNITIRLNNETAYFFANYTNRTSGENITGACSINFSDTSGLMWFNSTKNIYEYSRNFSTTGRKSYSINCSSSDFEPLESSGYVLVSNCKSPDPTTNWMINETTGNVTCIFENFLLNQSNLIVQAGYQLTLENTNLTWIDGNTNALRVNQSSNLTLKNSIITATGNSALSVYVYGTANFDSAVFNETSVYIYGNQTNFINNSAFYGAGANSVHFKENSISFVYNTNFSNDVYFAEGSSENPRITLQNSHLLNNIYFYNATVNFTEPASSMANNMYVGSGLPRLYGFVSMPSTYSFGGGSPAPSIRRYYPVIVRYSNSSTGIANKSINITSLGNLVWNGTTDSNGNVIANLTLNKTNYGNGNFTISVNPSQNISLLTTTPIIFDISDPDSPLWSSNSTDPNSNFVYNPFQTYQFLIDWTDNVAISSVLFEHNFNGTLKNESYSGNSVSTYYYTYQSLAAGTYQWASYANDTFGHLNKTDLWNYTVNQAAGQVSLLLNGTAGNLNMAYGSQINASASTLYGNLTLYRNGTDVSAENNTYVSLGVGYYNYTVVSTGNQNYSQSSITRFVNITKASSSVNLTLNNIDGDITVNTGDSVTINSTLIFPASGRILLYLDNNLINNATDSLKNSTSFSSAGTYNATSYYIGNESYSSFGHTHFITVQSTTTNNNNPGGGGGGGGGSYVPSNASQPAEQIPEEKTCAENWNCSKWTNCKDKKQARQCSDLNNCGTSTAKPSIEQACNSTMLPSLGIEFQGVGWNWLYLLPLIIMIITILFLIWRKRENDIEILIRKAIDAIRHKKMEKAKKLYIKIHALYMKLPFEKKKKYSAHIRWIYESIRRIERK